MCPPRSAHSATIFFHSRFHRLRRGTLVFSRCHAFPGRFDCHISFCRRSGALCEYKAGIAAAVCGPFAFLLLGMLLADFETRRAGTVVLDTPVTTTITGTVARREVDARGYWRYVVDLTATADPTLSRPPQRISVLSRDGGEPIALGATLRGKVRLSPPSGPALPGLNDFAFTSYFKGIGATGFFINHRRRLYHPLVTQGLTRVG